jgi:hypothetical protein
MMTEQKNKIKLPTQEYVIEIKEFKFKVEPLSNLCIAIIDRLQELGASVISNSTDYPTSVFISYESNTCGPTKAFNHTVVGAKLKLTLSLLDNSHKRNEARLNKLLDCLYEVEKGNLPSGATGIELVQVINKYEF